MVVNVIKEPFDISFNPPSCSIIVTFDFIQGCVTTSFWSKTM